MIRPGIRRLFRLPFHRKDLAEQALEDEIRLHIDMRAEQFEREGMSPEEARAEAMRRFGPLDEVRQSLQRTARRKESRMRFRERIEALELDLRYAIRMLMKGPGFAIAAVLTLALGIGANTAVFSVVDGVILEPLPYPEPEQIVYLGWDWVSGGRVGALNPLKFAYWREHARIFEGVATYKPREADLSPAPDYDGTRGLRVSRDFFEVVGIRPVIGRAFTPEENRPGGPQVAILGHEFWHSRFGAEPDVVGRPLRLDGEMFTIVGVMPPDFRFVGMEDYDDFLVPLRLAVDPGERGHNYNVIARLAPGIGPERVEADLARVLRAFRTEYPERVDAEEKGVYTTSYQDLFVAELQVTLWVLLGATLLVLLIACADVANLLLARATGRQREIAMRMALGAGRGRIARQLLVESLLLGILAGTAGLFLGVWSLDALLAAAPWSLPRADGIGLDERVFGFTLLTALGMAVAFGLTSAFTATRLDLAGALKEDVRGGEALGRRRTRNHLIVAETAVSFVLLVGAGLLIASFVELLRVDPGFETKGIVTVDFERVPEGYDDAARIWSFERQVLERIQGLPGVAATAGITILPFDGQWNVPITVEGWPDATEGAVQWRGISPDYFRTMGIRILRGRAFTAADVAGGPPVAIVTRAMAERYWPDGNALGQRILLGVYEGRISAETPAGPREIVGIVNDTRDIALNRAPWRTVFIPQAQVPEHRAVLPAFVIRTGGSVMASRDAIEQAIHGIEPRMPAPRFRTMEELVMDSTARERFIMLIMMLFAGLALVLTAIGIYSVVSHTVGQRTREIGIRMTLGGSHRAVMGLVMRQGMGPVLVGLGIGLTVAFALTRVLSGMLYGVGARDPVTFVAVALVLSVVALLANYSPARRATRIDPMATLRQEG